MLTNRVHNEGNYEYTPNSKNYFLKFSIVGLIMI